jgi:hypothetical protein
VTRVQAWADARGIAGKVTCSSGLKPPSALSARPDFICLVRRSPLDCTVLHVSGRNRSILVRVIRPHGDCAQPL